MFQLKVASAGDISNCPHVRHGVPFLGFRRLTYTSASQVIGSMPRILATNLGSILVHEDSINFSTELSNPPLGFIIHWHPLAIQIQAICC